MLILSETLFIAKGTERICYQHPNDAHLCVKVCHSSNNKQHRQEKAYLQLIQGQKKLPNPAIPMFHGVTETSQGEGLIFDRVQNGDGSNALSLRHFLNQNPQSPPPPRQVEQVKQALQTLKTALLKYNLIVRDLNINNILIVQNETTLHAILIDGFGNSDFIPLASYARWYGRMKTKRRWRRFEHHFEKFLTTLKV